MNLLKHKYTRSYFLLSIILSIYGCGDGTDPSKPNNSPRNRGGTPTATPTPTPTGEGQPPGRELNILDMKSGVNRDIQQSGDLTLEIEQGNPISARDVKSTDGSLDLSVRGLTSPK